MRLWAAFLIVVAFAACGRGGTAQPQRTGPLLIDDKGITMPMDRALAQIAFAPYVPTDQVIAVAVIPPLGGQDFRGSRGLAIEYERGGDALLLSQWPRRGMRINIGMQDVTDRPCTVVGYSAGGYLWTTRSGRVMTLQSDGPVAGARIEAEARRLLRSGACGGPVRTPPRSRRRLPSPDASSRRRSAS
jgi:hypothetical protein